MVIKEEYKGDFYGTNEEGDQFLREMFEWQKDKIFFHRPYGLSRYLDELTEGLSNEEILGSDEYKISQNSYYRIKNGVTEIPKTETLMKLVHNLKLNSEQKQKLFYLAGRVENPEETFGTAFKRALEKRRYQTAYAFVKGNDLSNDDKNYRRRLNGERNPTPFELLKICVILETDEEETLELWHAAGYELNADSCIYNRIMWKVLDGELDISYIKEKLDQVEVKDVDKYMRDYPRE